MRRILVYSLVHKEIFRIAYSNFRLAYNSLGVSFTQLSSSFRWRHLKTTAQRCSWYVALDSLSPTQTKHSNKILQPIYTFHLRFWTISNRVTLSYEYVIAIPSNKSSRLKPFRSYNSLTKDLKQHADVADELDLVRHILIIYKSWNVLSREVPTFIAYYEIFNCILYVYTYILYVYKCFEFCMNKVCVQKAT